MNSIEIPQEMHAVLSRHFFQNELEQGAFLFATANENAGGVTLRAIDYYLVPPSGWERHLDIYLQMRDSERAKIMKLARERDACAIDCHSHPKSGQDVWFSPSDVYGIGEFAPYAKWKLSGRPFAAIFGCVDHDGPRLILTEFAAAYDKPLIDIGTEIFPSTADHPFDFGGRVVVALPGDYCLFCADQIDRELAKADLESAEVSALRKKHGYGLGDDGPAPSVCSLNGIVANLAMTEFICLVTGLRPPARKLSYRGLRGVVVSSEDRGSADCYTCKCIRGQLRPAL